MYDAQLELLEALCNGRISVKEWVELLKELSPTDAEEVSLEEIPEPIRTHELEHARVIEMYGFKPSFIRRKDGSYATVFDVEKLREWERNDVLRFLLEVYGSPSSYSAYDHLAFYLIYFALRE